MRVPVYLRKRTKVEQMLAVVVVDKSGHEEPSERGLMGPPIEESARGARYAVS
jgi:hypothetical protein